MINFTKLKELLSNKDLIIWLLCLDGTIDGIVNGQIKKMEKNYFCCSLPLAKFNITYFSSNAKVCLLYEDVKDRDFLTLMQPILSTMHSYRLHDNPIIEIPNFLSTKFVNVAHEVALLEEEMNECDDTSRNILTKYNCMLKKRSLILDIIHWHLRNTKPFTVRNIEHSAIFGKFMRSLDEHCKSHRKIDFYAQEQNMSTSHFNAIIKGFSGKSPKVLIDEEIISKIMLDLTVAHLSLTQIVADYNFSDVAHLTRFFKRITGTTPTQYKEKFITKVL